MMSFRSYKILSILLLTLSSCSYLMDPSDVKYYLLDNDFYSRKYNKLSDYEIEKNVIVENDTKISKDSDLDMPELSSYRNEAYKIGNEQINVSYNSSKEYSFDNVHFYERYGLIRQSNFTYDSANNKIYFYDGRVVYEYKNANLLEVINNPFSIVISNDVEEYIEKYKHIFISFSNDELKIYQDAIDTRLQYEKIEYCKISFHSENMNTILERKKYDSNHSWSKASYFAHGNNLSNGQTIKDIGKDKIIFENRICSINEEAMTIDYLDEYVLGNLETFICENSKLKNNLFDINMFPKKHSTAILTSVSINSFVTEKNIYFSLTYYASKEKLGQGPLNPPCYVINYVLKINRETGKISYYRTDCLSYFKNLVFENNNYYFEIYSSNEDTDTNESNLEADYKIVDIYKVKLD